MTKAIDCSRRDLYLPYHELDEITSCIVVFAHAKPDDKIDFAKSLQRHRLGAAITGDGVNERFKKPTLVSAWSCRALRSPMERSDMIFLDDNLVGIVAAVERGCVICANIPKFVIVLISTNIGKILLSFGAVAAACSLPMEPLQILVVNFLTDGMPGAALSMKRDKSHPRSQALIHDRLWKVVPFNAIVIATGVLTVLLLGAYWNSLHIDGKTSYVGTTCTRCMGIGEPWKTDGTCAAQFANDSCVLPGLETKFSF